MEGEPAFLGQTEVENVTGIISAKFVGAQCAIIMQRCT
jgi:hypothetical protein